MYSITTKCTFLTIIFLTVDCEINSDCATNEKCDKNLCINPCLRDFTICGENAECITENHKSTCQCFPGTKGDPYIECKTIECLTNNDCKTHQICYENRCINPCDQFTPCGEKAQCRVYNHTHACSCPSGLEGNPNFSCSLPPKKKTGCLTDLDCPEGFGCIFNSSVTRYHNKVSAVYIRFDDASSGSVCRDLCEEHKPCGANAICSVIKSLPKRLISCACPEGYHGDAKLECRESKCKTLNFIL